MPLANESQKDMHEIHTRIHYSEVCFHSPWSLELHLLSSSILVFLYLTTQRFPSYPSPFQWPQLFLPLQKRGKVRSTDLLTGMCTDWVIITLYVHFSFYYRKGCDSWRPLQLRPMISQYFWIQELWSWPCCYNKFHLQPIKIRLNFVIIFTLQYSICMYIYGFGFLFKWLRVLDLIMAPNHPREHNEKHYVQNILGFVGLAKLCHLLQSELANNQMHKNGTTLK